MVLQAIVASFNSSSTIASALHSAVEQAIPVTLVDDGSSDGSDVVASTFRHVDVIKQTNSGPSVARNRGILESRAEFVLFLDSDDLLRPGYREAFERAYQEHPDADVFVCGMEVVDEQGKTLGYHEAPTLSPTPYLSVLRDAVPTNGIIVRRSLFHRTGLFDTGLRHAEDWDLWLRLAAATDKWVRMDHRFAVYRLRGGSLSKDGARMWSGSRKVLRRAWRNAPLPLPLRLAALTGAYRRAARYCWATGFSASIRREISAGRWLGVSRLIARNPVFFPLAVRDVLQWLRRRTTGKGVAS